MNTKTAEEILAFRGLTISTRHSIEGSYNTIDAMEEYASPLKKRIEELEEMLMSTIGYFEYGADSKQKIREIRNF